MSVEPNLKKKGKLNNGIALTAEIKINQPNHDRKKKQSKSNSISDKSIDEHDAETIIDLNKVNSRRKLIQADKQTNISGQDYNKRLRDFYSNRIQNTQFISWAGKEVIQSNEEGLSQFLNYNKDQQQKSNILQSRLMTNNDLVNPLRFLQPQNINIKKLSYVKHQDKGDAVVQSIAFHSRLPVFVTGGFDKVLRIYQIKPDQNRGQEQIELLKTVFLEKFPISEVKFMNTSNVVIISSFQKKYLIAYDIKDNTKKKIQSPQVTMDVQSSGKRNCLIKFCIDQNDNYIAVYSESGYINILDATSYQYKFGFKQNEACFSVCFNEDYLFSSGQGGKIYQWSLEKRAIHNVINCPGAFQVNTLSVKNNILAAGSQTGIVSLFKINPVTNKLSKEPIKEIQNLQTSISHLEFNHLGEYLCMVSKWKPNAFRILHADSLTVFQNWPNMKTNLKYIHSLAISADSRYLVFGNELGEVVVYQVQHY